MAEVVEVKSIEEFENSVEKGSGLALVDFYATWCGPCKMQAPIIEKIAQSNISNLKVLKLDVDELTDVAVKYGVSAVPTLILFKNGEIVNRWVGLTPEHIIREVINNNLG
jgi:thioredoxin 1